METEYLIGVILSLIIAFMGWVMQRKTERIKIMENQLSENKYKAYADMVGLFFSILKDAKRERKSNQEEMMDKMLESKKSIFMYGSDSVIKAFNKWLCSTTANEIQTTQLNAFLDFMIEIRKDMSGNSTKISKYDLLINLTQNKDEVNRLWSEISKVKKQQH